MRTVLSIGSVLFSTSLIAGGDPCAVSDESRMMSPLSSELVYDVECLNKSAGDKFVYVDIARVVNPKSIPLAFMLHYQDVGQEKFYLGSFALYPADNPGKFIVATQGKVAVDGELLLTLVPLETQESDPNVKVEVRQIKLTNTLEVK